MTANDDTPESGSTPSTAPRAPDRRGVLERVARIGASAQAAIPGLYAWAITVAPAAWSRGAPPVAKVAAVVGVLALMTAPLVEGMGADAPAVGSPSLRKLSNEVARRRWALVENVLSWTGPTWARAWSIWGFVLSSSAVWAFAPSAVSAPRFDGVRGALGMIGWALFAFASAGPALRSSPSEARRIVASTSLKPRNELPRGDGVYVTVGIVLALAMQAVGWGVVAPERAVLVRLVTVVCGIAVLGATTSIALSRHGTRTTAPRPLRFRRALPWLVVLALLSLSGVALGLLG